MDELNGDLLSHEENDLHRLVVDSSPPGALPDPERVREIVNRRSPLLSPYLQRELTRRVLARLSGLGPLEALLEDPSVNEIMVNGSSGGVWVESDGSLRRIDLQIGDSTLRQLIERIVSPLGLRADRTSSLVDARLPDGSRVNVVMPPVAVDGPYLSIRRFKARRMEVSDFASRSAAELLRWMVRARANILLSGGTGAGKTTFLNTLAGEISQGDRIVTVEDAAELDLHSDHVVRLEARPRVVEGLAPVTVRDLVRNALRMRPDRILLGEVRSAEAFDLLQAMNTGHDGCMSTCHANGASDALRRLESMAMTSDSGLPLDALREQIASALDFVVHLTRESGGRRQVTEVAEVRDPAGPPEVLTTSGELVSLPQRPGRDPNVGPPETDWLDT